MAASIYTQEEINELLEAEKFIDYDAYENPERNRRKSDDSFSVHADGPPGTDMEFKIEATNESALGMCSITLKARIHPRDWRAIARYDIHDSDHYNPPWYPPPCIEPGVPHAHTYKEKALEYDRKWSACARPLDDLAHPSPAALWSRFVADMHIRFTETRTHQALFGFMNRQK